MRDLFRQLIKKGIQCEVTRRADAAPSPPHPLGIQIKREEVQISKHESLHLQSK